MTLLGVQFVEEPLQDPAELQQLSERLHSASNSIPLALDETVDETFHRDRSFDEGIAELKRVLEFTGKAAPISALVLKPAVIGGLARCMAIAQVASTYNIKASQAFLSLSDLVSLLPAANQNQLSMAVLSCVVLPVTIRAWVSCISSVHGLRRDI